MKKIYTMMFFTLITIISSYTQTDLIDSVEPPDCQAYFYFYPVPETFENGLAYQFTDQSSGDVVSREWDFGDGTLSKESNPVHYYMRTGDTVQVCLTITTAGGCTGSYCSTFVIGDGQYQECPVEFNVIVMESFPPQYRFIPSRPDTFASYFWDFGDGNWSDAMEPSHTYQFSGTYLVCLSYSSPDGCSYYTCDTLQVQGYDPGCQAFYYSWPSVYTWEDSASADSIYLEYPSAYTFTDQSKGNVIAWKWDFGDSTSGEGQTVVHQYQNAGLYNVCLEIFTSDSCSDVYCSQIFVEYPSRCNYSGTVKDYTGLDGCGFVIELDDGSVIEPAEVVPDFQFIDGQRVMVGFTWLDDRASICMAGRVVRIDCITEIGYECDARFWYYEFDWLPEIPTIYKFEMIAGFGADEVLWTFSDGTSSNEFSPIHYFPTDGFYTVCLKVSSGNGCTASYCDSARFKGKEPIPGLCENFIRLETNILLNGQVCSGYAHVGLEDRFGNSVPVSSILWSTGNTEPDIFNLCPGMAYSVILTDAAGCAVSGSFILGSTPVYPDSLIGRWNFEQYDMDFIFNLPVYSDSLYCEWDFGDGYTAEGRVVNHTYSTPDNYTVHLKVYDNTGNILYTEQIPVNAGNPTGIRHRETDSPKVYPVPAKDRLYIEISGPERAGTVEIVNADGSIAGIVSCDNQSGPVTEINISALPAGFYIGKISYNNGMVRTFRFIK